MDIQVDIKNMPLTKKLKAKIKFLLKKIFNLKITIIVLIILSAIIVGTYKVNQFFESKMLEFNSPVEVKIQAPVLIVDRPTIENPTIIQVIQADDIPLTDNEKYLCSKFGDQCKTALEIQRRENVKGDCDALYVNDNGTVDLGYLQINSVHLSNDITMAQLVDCKANIDIAYNLYKKFGWKIWSTYKYIK